MACNVSPHDKQVLRQIFSQGLPFDDDPDTTENADGEKTQEIEDETIKRSKAFEVQGVKAAESGDMDLALDFFSQAIAVSPTWASAYNNRAQALRLRGDEMGAEADLEKAIELSHEKGTAACQAFTQRGLLRKKNGDDEGAKQDLEKAAKLGGGFAKQMLVAMNPYAAMCNQMLGEVMQKLRSGEDTSQ